MGRSNDLDVVLVEDMVSRKHARITYANDALSIEDLGSTNGTFVNGEKIKRARLKEGDRVLIGTSIVRVTATDAPSGASGETREAEARARMQNAAQRTTNVKSMSGTIDEVPLVDLLQLFATSKKSGVLVITHDDTVGKIFLRKGQIAFASINDNAEIGPLKSIYRLLTWETGFFDLQPPDEREFNEEIQLSTEAILMEGMRQYDECRRLQSSLPSPSARLTLPHPLTPPLRDLDAKELTALQAAYNAGRVDAALDRSPLTDYETLDVITRLIQKGYLRAEG
ncbi:MAG: DUF4388 domain-containing protein [Polyangiales bacterium]